jgi:hypothetical protein
MDDLQDKIAQIMSDPEALSQVQSLGKMLGLSPQQPPAPEPPPENDSPLSAESLSKLTKLMPLFSQVRQEDDVTRLLSALRPFLREEKIQKLESAKRMLQLMKLLPMLREGGLFELF